MKRRGFTLLAGAAAIAPAALQAQALPTSRRVGGLSIASQAASAPFYDAFKAGMRDLGWVEGRNVAYRFLFADGQVGRLDPLAGELLAQGMEVIVVGPPQAARALQKATTTVPIVTANVSNAVGNRFVASLARPGGNITGISSFGGELVARRLQLLKDFVPQGKRFAVLANPNYLDPAGLRNLLDRLEPQVGAPVSMVLATGPEQYDAAFAELTRLRVDGVVVLADPTTWTHRERLQQLVLAHKLPSVWGGGPYLGEAGLASYQSDFPALWRRAGAIVAKVLNGANPADVPFEQASKLELVVNLKAARRLGIEVPQSILISADKVIE